MSTTAAAGRKALAWRSALFTCAFTCALALGLTTASLAGGSASPVATAVELAGRADEITDDLAPSLGAYAEPALAEYQSFAKVIGYLAKAGFDLQAGVGGVPTALVASAGDGRPVLGIRAGMDADPVHGHSLGHNLETAASVASAIALKESLRELRLPGTVKLFLYPAGDEVDTWASVQSTLSGLDALIAARAGAVARGDRLSASALKAAGYPGPVGAEAPAPAELAGWAAQVVPTAGFTFAAWAPGTAPGSPAAVAQSAAVDGAEKAWFAAKALSALGMTLLSDPAALAQVKSAFQASPPEHNLAAALPPEAFPEAPGISVRADGMVRVVAHVSNDEPYVVVPEPLVKVVLGAYDCGV